MIVTKSLKGLFKIKNVISQAENKILSHSPLQNRHGMPLRITDPAPIAAVTQVVG